jgi:hypothetical protein
MFDQVLKKRRDSATELEKFYRRIKTITHQTAANTYRRIANVSMPIFSRSVILNIVGDCADISRGVELIGQLVKGA